MLIPISIQHQQRFDQIRQSLLSLGSSEGNFVKVELLFFEVLAISKDYGEDSDTNALLAAVRQLQANQYEMAKVTTVKKNLREQSIRKFIIGLKKVLSHH